ncbi:unnamed protein product [Amoebophrya sp. A25]|nr:unnamed protein product [Amoebophrya sp. A25]|eukprot:GSA25T00024202001.1
MKEKDVLAVPINGTGNSFPDSDYAVVKAANEKMLQLSSRSKTSKSTSTTSELALSQDEIAAHDLLTFRLADDTKLFAHRAVFSSSFTKKNGFQPSSVINIDSVVVQDPRVWHSLICWAYRSDSLLPTSMNNHSGAMTTASTPMVWTALRWWQLLCACVKFNISQELKSFVLDRLIRDLREDNAPEVLGMLLKSSATIGVPEIEKRRIALKMCQYAGACMDRTQTAQRLKLLKTCIDLFRKDKARFQHLE